jgi:hypothetical protein
MLWLLCVATYLIVTAGTFEQKFQVVSLFAWPIMIAFAGAFSLDWISKQTTIAGPPASADPTVIAETEIKVPTVTTVTTTAAAPPETSS